MARWDPREHLMSLRREIDRLFESEKLVPGRFFGTEVGLTPIDLVEDDQSITVKAELPGIAREELEISVSGNLLTIRGEHKAEEEKKDQNYLRREIRYGRVERMIDLPAPVDVDKADAAFQDGILTLKFPKKEQAKAKTIEIRG
jgi:HSP20 family protein